MALKKWIVGSPDLETAKLMAEECDADPFTALIACSRGVCDSSEFEQLLDEEPQLSDPYELKDIRLAADIVNKAISENKTVAIFGDYDCDGVVATAIMFEYLTSRNASVVTYIPDRADEGYGMNKKAVDYLHSKGVELIITVDNGISCSEEIDYANSLGITTVVTDHHLPPPTLPNAAAVVDPHRADCPSAFKEVCGAQVAFKLVCVMDDKEPEQLLWQYADLLCIATVGDVMPLINENRSIVREGIKRIKTSARVGVSAILNSAGIDRDTLNASRVSFGIVPRLNAAGRMGDANRALNLLCSKDMLQALNIANNLDEENAQRQNIERKITAEASEIIEAKGYNHNRVIVVAGEGWKIGVVGIVASRISEKYGKPTIVLSVEEGIAHGSGRSFSGFNLYNAINAAGETLEKYGGHELAAGVSVKEENICKFRNKINEYANSLEPKTPELNIDFKINPLGMTVDMAFAIKALEPFGAGNPVPVFGIFDVAFEKITPLSSGKHLRLMFSKNGTEFQALLFGVTEKQLSFEIGDRLDLAVTLDANLYHDQYSLSVIIKAIRLTGVSEERLFADIYAVDRFMSGLSYDAKMLLPTREETGEVYKYIYKNSVSAEKVKYKFLKDLGFAKTQIAIKSLNDLGLISIKEGIISSVPGAQKTDLNRSKTYNLLSKGVKNSD